MVLQSADQSERFLRIYYLFHSAPAQLKIKVEPDWSHPVLSSQSWSPNFRPNVCKITEWRLLCFATFLAKILKTSQFWEKICVWYLCKSVLFHFWKHCKKTGTLNPLICMYVSFILAQEKHIYTISDISIVLGPH